MLDRLPEVGEYLYRDVGFEPFIVKIYSINYEENRYDDLIIGYTVRVVWSENGKRVFHGEENGMEHSGFEIHFPDNLKSDRIVSEDEVLAFKI